MSLKKVSFTITTLKWLCECNQYLIQYTNKERTRWGSRSITKLQLKNLKKHLHIQDTEKAVGSSFNAQEDIALNTFANLIS